MLAASRCRGHCQGTARCKRLTHFTERAILIKERQSKDMTANLDSHVVEGFGDEWSRFDQSNLDESELRRMFASYFAIFPWEKLPPDAEGFDLGCGSGRWARQVAPRVGRLHCIDPSPAALNVARRNLADRGQCEFHQASVDSIPLSDNSADFGYSLGVLHHVPDTAAGIIACVRKLKRGAPLLLYIYYAFDNRPSWYRAIWKISNIGRLLLSRSPYPLRYAASQIIAFGIYWPMARLAWALERLGRSVDALPLAFYRDRSLYVLRTDALDRFGTRLEQRFSRQQIQSMMEEAGLSEIVFSDSSPFWCAVGIKQ